MSKIVTAHYTNVKPSNTTINSGQLFQTSTVAPSGMRDAITIGASNMRCVKVPLLSEGYLNQILVKQTSGTSVPFVVECLMSGMPYPVGEYSAATGPVGTVELYRIIAQQSVTAGSPLDIMPDYELGWPFRNVDGDHTNNQRFIYLVIIPTGAAGSTTWDAFVMAHSNCD